MESRATAKRAGQILPTSGGARRAAAPESGDAKPSAVVMRSAGPEPVAVATPRRGIFERMGRSVANFLENASNERKAKQAAGMFGMISEHFARAKDESAVIERVRMLREWGKQPSRGELGTLRDIAARERQKLEHDGGLHWSIERIAEAQELLGEPLGEAELRQLEELRHDGLRRTGAARIQDELAAIVAHDRQAGSPADTPASLLRLPKLDDLHHLRNPGVALSKRTLRQYVQKYEIAARQPLGENPYDKGQSPERQFAKRPPEQVIADIARGDTRGLPAAKLPGLLKDSFALALLEHVCDVQSTLSLGNPLFAARATRVMQRVDALLALAAKHGVSFDMSKPTREAQNTVEFAQSALSQLEQTRAGLSAMQRYAAEIEALPEDALVPWRTFKG